MSETGLGRGRGGAGPIWAGAIGSDRTSLDRMIACWRVAHHQVPRDPPGPDGVILKDPSGFPHRRDVRSTALPERRGSN